MESNDRYEPPGAAAAGQRSSVVVAAASDELAAAFGASISFAFDSESEHYQGVAEIDAVAVSLAVGCCSSEVSVGRCVFRVMIGEVGVQVGW